MLQTEHCINFGRVLMNDKLQVFLLCANCHTDFDNVAKFRIHLETCSGLERFFENNPTLAYDCNKGEQLYQKTTDGVKEFFIYNFDDVQKVQNASTKYVEICENKNETNLLNIISIEEELLNPRWYELANSAESNNQSKKEPLKYSELVQEVTPFVQFKENLKVNAAAEKVIDVAKLNNTEKNAQNTKLVRNAKRRINMDKNKTKVPEEAANTTQVDITSKTNAALTNRPDTIIQNELITTNLVEKTTTETIIHATQAEAITQPTLTTVEHNTLTNTTKTISLNATLVKLTDDPEKRGNFDKNVPALLLLHPVIAAPMNKQLSEHVPPDKTECTINATLEPAKKNERDDSAIYMASNPKRRKTSGVVEHIQKVTTENTKIVTNLKKIVEENVRIVNQNNTHERVDNINNKPAQTKELKMPPLVLIQNTESNKKPVNRSILSKAPVQQKQTEQIINKLQTLGLKVKRTTTTETKTANSAEVRANARTLEILKKLQSNGMNVKLVPCAEKAKDSVEKKTVPAITAPTNAALASTMPISKNVSNSSIVKPNPMYKTIIIKKMNN